MTPFTPRNRDNLIGLMMARCDGEHLGEKVVLLLSKQEIILGPMQVEARINQDQNISKDLTLWNQQGSQVLARPDAGAARRAYIPVCRADLHPGIAGQNAAVEEGRSGDGQQPGLCRHLCASAWRNWRAKNCRPHPKQPPAPERPQRHTSTAARHGATDARIAQIRQHFQRYRELVSQGKLSEAGKELEAIQGLVEK